MPDTLPMVPDPIVITAILPEYFGIKKAGVELVRKAGLAVSVGCAGVQQAGPIGAACCEGASAPAVKILELGVWLPGSPGNGHTGEFPQISVPRWDTRPPHKGPPFPEQPTAGAV